VVRTRTIRTARLQGVDQYGVERPLAIGPARRSTSPSLILHQHAVAMAAIRASAIPVRWAPRDNSILRAIVNSA